eukprot:CFRG2631T1
MVYSKQLCFVFIALSTTLCAAIANAEIDATLKRCAITIQATCPSCFSGLGGGKEMGQCLATCFGENIDALQECLPTNSNVTDHIEDCAMRINDTCGGECTSNAGKEREKCVGTCIEDNIDDLQDCRPSFGFLGDQAKDCVKLLNETCGGVCSNDNKTERRNCVETCLKDNEDELQGCVPQFSSVIGKVMGCMNSFQETCGGNCTSETGKEKLECMNTCITSNLGDFQDCLPTGDAMDVVGDLWSEYLKYKEVNG